MLVVAPVAPWPAPLSGAQQRVRELIRALCQSHVVDVIITGQQVVDPPDGWSEQMGCRSVVVLREAPPKTSRDPLWGSLPRVVLAMAKAAVGYTAPPVIEHRRPWRLQGYLASLPTRYDAIVAVRMWVSEAVLASRSEPVVLDYDDSVAELLEQDIHRLGHYRRRLLHRLQLAGLRRYEARLARRHAAVAIVRPEDRDRWQSRDHRNIIEVPNGIEIPARRERMPRNDRILFIGAFFHHPNLEALEWLMKKVMPIVWRTRPEVEVIAAGRRPMPDGWQWLRSTAGLQCVESPPELSALYDTAGVVVAPIQSGSGTKIKVLEALANGAPLVATSAGVHGIPATPSVHYMLADAPEAFAQACLAVLENPGSVDAMCAAGYDFVARYSWEEIGRQFRASIDGILRADQDETEG
jgi:glycosyltransferase involved in cell wall biosynthesis